MKCSQGDGNEVFTRGYCQACYTRLRRNGTVERKNVINSGMCSVEGCGRPSFAKNLCNKHYAKFKHPIWNIWKTLCSRFKGQLPESWMRFDGFFADVGERPSELHRLKRKDEAQPFSAENVFWKPPVLPDSPRSEASMNPVYKRQWHLSNKFGIQLADYMKMYVEQDGKCACCRQPETAVDRKGNVRPLAVDHDHKTGEVRGLACNRCNHVFGLANDDISVLQAAIDYLNRHSGKDKDNGSRS
jgi:hypothetical protein